MYDEEDYGVFSYEGEDNEHLLTADKTEYDIEENVLRPKTLQDYVGQQKVKENLLVYMQAAKARGEALDHVLL